LDRYSCIHCQVSSIHRQAPSPAAADATGPTDPQQPAGQGTRELAVIVHVLGDYAFKKYVQHCSASDLMLLRGLLLKVR
jgi:hypothetical protein